MKLDSRIKNGKTYLDCFHTETAKKFIGKECYIADEISGFSNLDDVTKATLIDVTKHDSDTQPYTLSDKESAYVASLILPCEWVEEPEKRYRPFTGIEFTEKFNLKLNSIIHLRTVPTDNRDCCYYKVVFTGYRWYDDVFQVFLNGSWLDLPELLVLYEYREDGEWHKFGVEG